MTTATLTQKVFYIYEEKSDWSGDEQVILESAYFGPWDWAEALERLEDPYADLLEAAGADVTVIELSDEEAKKYTINSPEFWMSQLGIFPGE